MPQLISIGKVGNHLLNCLLPAMEKARGLKERSYQYIGSINN